MASRKISSLTELATTPDSGDLLQVIDVSDTTYAATGTNKKIQFSNLIPAPTYRTMFHGSFFDVAIRDVYLPITGESENTLPQRWSKIPMGYDGFLKKVVVRREYTPPTSGDLTVTLQETPGDGTSVTNVEAITVTPTYGSVSTTVFDFTSAAVLQAGYTYNLLLTNGLNYAMGNTSFTIVIEMT